MSIHLKIKTKWRWIRGVSHCFVREGKIYESLCGRHELPKAYGASCRRPPPILRCGMCDVREIKAYDWDESGPDRMGWEEGR